MHTAEDSKMLPLPLANLFCVTISKLVDLRIAE